MNALSLVCCNFEATCPTSVQIIKDQIFLAAPSDCPLYPDGKKRSGGTGGGRARTVSLLVSADEGLSFEEACIPIKWLDKVGVAAIGLRVDECHCLCTAVQ